MRRSLCFALLALVAAASAALAGSTDPIYRQPHDTIADIVTTPYTPGAGLSRERDLMLLFERASLPPIAELAEPELRLAGYRIRPRMFGPSRWTPSAGLSVLPLETLEARAISGLPEDPAIHYVKWSPGDRYVSFVIAADEGLELWVADVEKAEARALTGPILNLTTRISPRWLDSETLLCTVKPEGLGEPPVESHVPSGPVIQENLGEKAPARTYQDLLEDAHDEALFDYYFTSQLAKVTVKGKLTRLGEPGIIDDYDPSPDGEYILVETLHRPYSYLVPASRFPRSIEILDRDGDLEKLVADLPLQENIPITFSSVEEGPRDHEWREDADATLMWVEALDGGDAGAEADERDRVFLMDAPFEEPRAWLTMALRFGGMAWGSGDVALAYEWWWKDRTLRTWLVRPDDAGSTPEVLWERSWQDRYADPGTPATRRAASGRSLLDLTDGKLHLMGNGASPEGDRPFYDTLDLATRETTRHFRSEAPYYESAVATYRDGRLITRREAVTDVPNYFVRDLASADLRQITDFPHPSPQLQGLQKELIQYEREDGVQLSGTLYLPAGYDAERDGPLPTILWAYPNEYKSADHAGQVKDSPYRFDRVGWWSPLLYLTQGYAVLDDPTMPVIGEEDEEPNDTFREQLVSSAAAAIDEVVSRGVTDPARIAVGGHSYGAFMTANLLAHSDLFAAGIARSGAYNRTLTPFGFQAEERSLWEAPDVYFDMSPFMHAEKVNEPILLIHGDADNNTGTYPMQSERYYNALRGHGAVARLVMLPEESHGYRAKESILHMLWEQEEWLAKYVKKEMATEEAPETR